MKILPVVNSSSRVAVITELLDPHLYDGEVVGNKAVGFMSSGIIQWANGWCATDYLTKHGSPRHVGNCKIRYMTMYQHARFIAQLNKKKGLL